MAVAESNVVRVKEIVETAIRRGCGMRAIARKIRDAVEGVGLPRQFGQRTLDMATLTYRISGRKLLYALSHGLGLPSLRTLRNHIAFTRIMPTLGTIKSDEIVHNIEEGLMKSRSVANRVVHRGVTVLIDEIALEEMAVHFKHANTVGGICWKHSHLVDLVLRTYDAAINLATGLSKGTVHLGKEMTVAAILLFGESGTYPILAAPTCKQEDADDMEFIFSTIIQSWAGFKGRVGAIWSIATDGDATRRKAGYNMFVKIPLSAASSLFGTLSNMLGLNLFTGDDEIMLDFDWKHILKRICTLLRSQAGIILNNSRVINPTLLMQYLVHSPGQTEDSVKKLLYPDDPQDVPRAIELMQAVIGLREVRLESNNLNTISDLDSLRLLGELLESILEPFINTSYDLTQQVEALSKYSHLAFSLFHTHRTTFMSNQLYGDSQTMVKNAMFYIAKQQVLDPNESFFLFNLGDDKLEKLFGRIRMLGAHDSGMNFRQGIDRLGHAVNIDRVLLCNPDLDMGQRRLNTTRVEGADHLNSKSWMGNACAGDCNLPSAWKKGREAAIHIFEASQIA
ncbi:hypothetical protein FB451DRAFT_1065033 [Mycena latifolia]|nr:hypothetical protein FB451DRAFT_1067362 [Mycena latifolia]KAJ7432928.1 hypothetical protein FB451DRAFT_1065033 [Mycena latifolia]